MSKAVDIAQVSAKGSLNFLWGLVFSTVISAVGTIFIARLLGSELYGLYTVALTAPNLIAIFRNWGINSAMIRFTAQYSAEERKTEIRSVIISGLIFEIAIGTILSLTSLFLSDFLATSVFNRPAIAQLIQIASFSILGSGLVSAASAAFVGTEKMQPNSLMIISQSIVKTLLMITLVLLGFGTSGAIIGSTSATIIGGLLGILFVWTIYKNLPKPYTLKLEVKAYIKEMLKFGVPLSLSIILFGFLGEFYNFLLPIYVANDTIVGSYGIARSFVILIGFFAIPITTMLFPAFSKLDAKKDNETLRNAYQFSIKYAALFVVPAATLVMSLSEPAVSTLFDGAYENAPLYLALLSVSYLYVLLGDLSTNNLINSQGKTKFILKLTVLTAVIGFPVGSILISQFGVIGLIAISLIDGLPSVFISLYWIRKSYNLTVDWRSSARILLSSAITAIITYIVVSQIELISSIRLLLGVLIFFVILIPCMLLTRAITVLDINNLRNIASGLGALRRPILLVLKTLEKLIKALKL